MIKYISLHGFLGSSSDWDQVAKNIKDLNDKQSLESSEFLAIDYLNIKELNPNCSLTEWAEKFNEYARTQFFSGNDNQKNILMGYSMGGRLALHAVTAENALPWHKVVFVSTNPGMKAHEDKLARLAQDKLWAQKFSKGPIEQVLEEWNQQGIFIDPNQNKETSAMPNLNKESRFKKINNLENHLMALINWSLSTQADFRHIIAKIKPQQLWLAGEHDQKYQDLFHEISHAKNSRLKIVSGATHRILVDQPKSLAEEIVSFSGL